MHEMRTIAIDVSVAWASVSLSACSRLFAAYMCHHGEADRSPVYDKNFLGKPRNRTRGSQLLHKLDAAFAKELWPFVGNIVPQQTFQRCLLRCNTLIFYYNNHLYFISNGGQ